MTDPLSQETILAEFSEDTEVWVLQDEKSKKYVTIPHQKCLGGKPNSFLFK